MREDEKIAALARAYVLAGLDTRVLSVLARDSRAVPHASGEVLFLAGDAPDGMRIVLSGLVRIWISDAEGRELTLALLEPGDAFGEIALLDGLPRSAGATAIEAGKCLLLPARGFSRALQAEPVLARHLVGVLCETLRRNTEALGAFAFLGLDGRLAQKLHDLAADHAVAEGAGARFVRRFSQGDLARMLGVSREAVNKRLKALVHDGIVRVEDGLLRVPDLSALAERGRAEASLSA
ncbi:Crp/Fnr family transcriptional regulator [Jannaschia seohaensis]|nr:Crp/Fnr family transcriptional regulator [Jannaschia seohaensis]